MVRPRGVEQFEVEIGGERLVVTSLPADSAADTAETLAALTAAERAVACDAAAGLSNAAIAKKRKRAVRTIANQLASIYRKLGVVSRAELALLVLGAADLL
ncbi:MAG TPA: helix-turn-helix transcriptional regulator [Kofleriaceae bacterium]|nr:helix-turn-helix transcriptional regulator [Kofleriaceae bacterium]